MNKNEPINSSSLIISMITLIVGFILLLYGNNKVYDINKERYGFNPYKTTYNSSFMPIKINGNILVGNDKELGTGVAYNSRKQKIEALKSNIFCDRDKYNQNSNLRDNFNPKNINHNNWFTNLDWRNNKSELIFYKNNQKEFYDNNSKANTDVLRNELNIYINKTNKALSLLFHTINKFISIYVAKLKIIFQN